MFGKPRPNGFLKICPQAQFSKTLTSGDLENEVMTPKVHFFIDIMLKLLIDEFGNFRHNSFLKSVCKLNFQRL